jgi:hypothetical protein
VARQVLASEFPEKQSDVPDKRGHNKTLGAVLVSFFNNPPTSHVIAAPECGGGHRIQFFSAGTRSRGTNYCWPDLVIIQNNKVRVIVELEQSGIVSAGKISSKLIPVLLSSCACNEDIDGGTIAISREATLIQVVNTTLLKPVTRKLRQYENLEADIRGLLPLGCIARYFLFSVLPDNAPPYDLEKYYPVLEAINQSLT